MASATISPVPAAASAMRAASLGVGRHGLLAQHVLARRDGAQRPLHVHADGQRHVDRVDVRARQQLVEGAVRAGDAVLARVLRERLGALVLLGHRHHLHIGQGAGVLDEREGRDAGGAQDADA
jgi:hypothetical protein